MPTPKRVTPWHTLSIAQGNVIQLGGLLGADVLAWYAGQKGVCGTRWMVASRLVVLLGARLLPLARRAYTRYPLHRVRPPRHEPFAALPTRDALGILAPALPERPHRFYVGTGGVARGARGNVRCRRRRDRDPERHDTRLPLVARRPTS